MRQRSAGLALVIVMALATRRSFAEGVPGEPESTPPPPGTLLSGIHRASAEDLSDWEDIRRTGREIWFHATHPTLKEGLGYAGVTLAALYLESHKYDLAGEIQEDRTRGADAVSSRFRPLGEAIVPAGALALWAVGRFSGSEKTRRAGLILTESAAFTALVTEIGQFVLSEQRPSDGGKLSFLSYGGHGVSGHTSIIASVSVPLDRLFFNIKPDDNGWMKTAKYFGKGIVYAAPVATGWSRINDDKHYAWNVVLGLGVGFTIGRFVSDAHELGDDSKEQRNWKLVPITDDHGAPGLGVRWSLP